MKEMQTRGSGILLPIFSLPSSYGVGTMGQEARNFVDFLQESKQKYWQILPVGQTSYGDSPYQSYSIHAGNPYFIDLDILKEEGLLKEEEYANKTWGAREDRVDYAVLYNQRYEVLEKAFSRFEKNEAYCDFLEQEKDWVVDYALFMSLKEENGGKGWYEWEDGLRFREEKALDDAKNRLGERIEFWIFVQYEFYHQWQKLHQYTMEKGIKIIGDIPIYVAYDSVDVWASPQYFELDEEKNPINVAGCPPDAFSAVGQLWGNPLYNWEYMKKEKYNWWKVRLEKAQSLYDIVRIDHFRGFESYYSIAAGSENALGGCWRKGPGSELFQVLREEMGEIEVIAEDLGYLTEEVKQMLSESGFPGMKLLQFAFDSRESGNYLPHNYVANSVGYIGTHDNDTAFGWLHTADPKDVEYMRTYFDFDEQGEDEEGKKKLAWKLIRKAMATVCNTIIITMQDYLMLGSDCRINTPSTLGNNWTWRMEKEAITPELIQELQRITELYQR
ncbi:MAG: 4-alpha-glucanotransferase [Lachnospiraceae bacterium]